MISLAWLRSQEGIIFGLCAFLAFLSFKPSEPYLSQYLVCNENTQQDFCSGYGDLSSCNENAPCMWSVTASSCDITPCSNVSHGDCGNSDYSYCEKDGSTCKDAKCYKDFSEDQVNDQIYPWSTYAYLPFLLILGPAAELCSYRAAILVGISGRLVTRFLLLYGNSILEMQLMQVAYAFGTAAEDVLAAYVYYSLTPAYYQLGTSYIKATSLATNVVAGVIGDLLVVEGGVSLRTLMWISAVSVCIGYVVGVVVLQPVTASTVPTLAEDIDTKNSDVIGVRIVSPMVEGDSNKGGLEECLTPLLRSPVSDALTQETQSTGTDHRAVSAANTSSSTPASAKISERTDRTSAVPTTSDKLRLFWAQLQYLRVAFCSKSLCALVGYWVVGNAVFSTLYDYEVAVYAELNGGSNAWNGSVLAVMLLAGTIGALLPAWLKHDVDHSDTAGGERTAGGQGNDGLDQGESSHHMQGAALSAIDGSQHSNSASSSPTESTSMTAGGDNAPKQAGFTTTSEFVVGMRVTVAGALSCLNLLLFVITWEVVASVSFLALFFATWQYINVVCFARLALALKVAQLEREDESYNGGDDGGRGRRDSDLEGTRIVSIERRSMSRERRRSNSAVSLGRAVGVGDVDPTASSKRSGSGGGGATDTNSVVRAPLFLTASSPGIEDAASAQDTLPSSPTPSGATAGASGPVEDIPEPPYSVALVSIIAANVVVQIVLQAVAFSGLALPLRDCCWIFVLTFCAATVAYVLCLLGWFGAQRMRQGLQSAIVS